MAKKRGPHGGIEGKPYDMGFRLGPSSAEKLVKKWRVQARKLRAKSKKTWALLGSGDLPQDDKIIYSVYEDQASAIALEECADELEKLK